MKNLGNVVSKVLSETGTAYENIVFQKNKPPLDSEHNLSQDIVLDKIQKIYQNIPSGFLEINEIETAPEDRSLLNNGWQNALIFNNPKAVVNGWLIDIQKGTNIPYNNSTLWHTLCASDPSKVAFKIGEPPELGTRADLIFLEVWLKLIDPTSVIKKYGFQQGIEGLPNDLIDEDIGEETTKRTQVQYRLRYAEGIDFISFKDGLGHPNCWAQGGANIPNAQYFYTKHPKDKGLYTAGYGDDQSKIDLNSVDGFTYAIPLTQIHRRSKNLPYSLENPNSTNKSISQGNSDRPDGLFYDEISQKDLVDLRRKISLTGFNYKELLNDNLKALTESHLNTVLTYNKRNDHVAGNTFINVDAINYEETDNLPDIVDINPNRVSMVGNQGNSLRVFSEAKIVQKTSFLISESESKFNTQNDFKLWFVPIGKKTASYELELWDENLFYVSGPILETFTGTNVNTSKSTLVIVNHKFIDNDIVYIKRLSGTLPSGLSEATKYYVSFVDANNIQLKPGISDLPITFLTTGSGNFRISTINLPKIYAFDENSLLFDLVVDSNFVPYKGTWSGLNVKGTWNYLPSDSIPEKNKITYSPDPADISRLQDKKLLIVFDLVCRENKTRGFSGTVNKMYMSYLNYGETFQKYIDSCTSYLETQEVALTSPRQVGIYKDKAYCRSIQSFEQGVESNNNITKRGGILEVHYFIKSTGASQEIIPSTVYGRSVLSVLSIYNVTQGFYNEMPLITKQPNDSLKINGILTNVNDIIQYTLLVGDYAVEYSPHTKGITNFARSYKIRTSSRYNNKNYVFNIKGNTLSDGYLQCDGFLSTIGYFNGSTYTPTCFVGGELKAINVIQGLGSSLIKIELKNATFTTGIPVELVGVGYYNPASSDKMLFNYETVAYKGILSSFIKNEEELNLKIKYLDDFMYVTSAGSGSKTQFLPTTLKGLVNNLPINKYINENHLFGESINTKISSGSSSLRKIPSFYSFNGFENNYLTEGNSVTLKMNDNNISCLRGGLLVGPYLSECGLYLDSPVNHLNYKASLVEKHGELFLMVMTSLCTKYNNVEGFEYYYLKEDDLYFENGLGKGTETIMKNNLTITELLNDGYKVLISVDIFNLKNRPLI